MSDFMRRRGSRRRRGQALVEFALCSLLVVALMLGVVEFGRMVLAFTTVSSAARVGVRFAMTHGLDNSVTTSDIQNMVKDYLSAAAIDTSSATVTVTYPSSGICVGGNGPGCPVTVTVSYPYQTMFTYYPINVTLSTQSQGVITF